MKYLVVLLGLCLLGCNNQKQRNTLNTNEVDNVKIEIPEGSLTEENVSKADNSLEKTDKNILPKDILIRLKNFSTAIIAINDIWSFQEEWERIVYKGEEGILQDSVKTIIKNISNTTYSLFNDSCITESINKYKRDISALLKSKPDKNYTQYADSLYKGIKEKIYKQYVYKELCSLNEDTFWVYIDRDRYIQNPNWSEYLAMDRDSALMNLDQRIMGTVDPEEKNASILTWADIAYRYYGDTDVIRAYQLVMEQGQYSIYLLEAWAKWRALMQFEIYGRSRDSEIPNKLYNQWRKECLNIIYQHIKKNPDDQMAINQYYTLADYKNMIRNGSAIMGNNSWIEMMKFFPHENN